MTQNNDRIKPVGEGVVRADLYTFFDTETNGKPLSWKASIKDLDNWPRITQLAWLVADDSGQTISEQSYVIKPDGWTVPKEKFFIEHNISTERCEAEGVSIKFALIKFLTDVLGSRCMIAHNIAFDYNVVGSEMIRAGLSVNRKTPKFCTMEESTNLLKLPGRFGEYKWPKLEELYRWCFKKEFEGAHDAMYDVRATKESFFHLKQNNHILCP